MALKVAVVSSDPEVRMAAARAFDSAPLVWDVGLHEEAPADGGLIVRASPEMPGDVVFDPAHPGRMVEELERRAAAERTNVFVVAAAAGGAGATTLALHLAASWGRGCCYAELGRGGAAARLDLPPDARRWGPGEEDVTRCALPVEGFHVLLAPQEQPSPLVAAASSFDRVVVDAASRGALDGALPAARAAVLVLPPTRAAARAAAEILAEHQGARWAIVTNRLGRGGQIMRAALEEIIGSRIAAELPCCPALRDAEDEGRLLRGPWHRWHRDVVRLARALEAC